MHDKPESRSSTSITLKIKDSWFNKLNEDNQRKFIKKIVSQLSDEKIAFDINGYNKAPPSLRLWGGATVKNNDMKLLLPWLDWSFNSMKNNEI